MGTKTKNRTWKELKDATMSKESQARARAEAEKIFAALPLAEVRRARELSQEQLAETLDMPQGNISKLERRVDMYVSTLRRYIQAMGGELDIIARFPDADIRLDVFGDIDHLTGEKENVESKRALTHA